MILHTILHQMAQRVVPKVRRDVPNFDSRSNWLLKKHTHSVNE
jgi:hypothetical protein